MKKRNNKRNITRRKTTRRNTTRRKTTRKKLNRRKTNKKKFKQKGGSDVTIEEIQRILGEEKYDPGYAKKIAEAFEESKFPHGPEFPQKLWAPELRSMIDDGTFEKFMGKFVEKWDPANPSGPHIALQPTLPGKYYMYVNKDGPIYPKSDKEALELKFLANYPQEEGKFVNITNMRHKGVENYTLETHGVQHFRLNKETYDTVFKDLENMEKNTEKSNKLLKNIDKSREKQDAEVTSWGQLALVRAQNKELSQEIQVQLDALEKKTLDRSKIIDNFEKGLVEISAKKEELQQKIMDQLKHTLLSEIFKVENTPEMCKYIGGIEYQITDKTRKLHQCHVVSFGSPTARSSARPVGDKITFFPIFHFDFSIDEPYENVLPDVKKQYAISENDIRELTNLQGGNVKIVNLWLCTGTDREYEYSKKHQYSEGILHNNNLVFMNKRKIYRKNIISRPLGSDYRTQSVPVHDPSYDTEPDVFLTCDKLRKGEGYIFYSQEVPHCSFMNPEFSSLQGRTSIEVRIFIHTNEKLKSPPFKDEAEEEA
jgi:hypothetical protein